MAIKLIDAFSNTLNTINTLMTGESDTTVQTNTVEKPVVTNNTVIDKREERLFTFKQISKMFDYKIDKRSNIFDPSKGGQWTFTENRSGTLCVPEHQLCATFDQVAPLDLNKQYYISAATISKELGLTQYEGHNNPLNKPLSTMANDGRIIGKRIGGTGAGRGSWRFSTEFINNHIVKAKATTGWNADPKVTVKYFLKELGYGIRGGIL